MNFEDTTTQLFDLTILEEFYMILQYFIYILRYDNDMIMWTNVDQDLGVGEVLIADGAPLSRVQQFQPSRERSSAR